MCRMNRPSVSPTSTRVISPLSIRELCATNCHEDEECRRHCHARPPTLRGGDKCLWRIRHLHRYPEEIRFG